MLENARHETTRLVPAAVLLDMDGTLVDHFHALYRCYEYAAQKLGIIPPTPEEVRRGVGGSMPVTIRNFFPADQIEQAMALWRERFDAIHLEDVVLLDGAVALLDSLKQLEIAAAVFTNKIGKHTRAICENEGIASRFDLIIGAEDSPYRKPQKAFSEFVLQRLGVTADQALLIGDSPFDIEAAHIVGMKAYCVPTGSHSIAELEESGADRVFGSLREIDDKLFRPRLDPTLIR